MPVTDLSIIIVNYNGGPLLAQTLGALFRHPCPGRMRVTVVDNGSTDGSAERAGREFPGAQIICTGENLGFARANNIGMAQAKARNYLLLNSDVIVPPGALKRMLTFLEQNSSVGIVGPKLVYADGRDQRAARRFPSPMNALFGRKSLLTRLFPKNPFSGRYMPEAPPGRDAYSVDWVSGACLMTRDEVVQRVGALDERYFMYWEDADWCFRVKQHGWQVCCLPDVEVVHLEGGSSGGTNPRLIWEFHRSVYHFYSKNMIGSRYHPASALAGLALMGRCLAITTLAKLSRQSNQQLPVPREDGYEQ